MGGPIENGALPITTGPAPTVEKYYTVVTNTNTAATGKQIASAVGPLHVVTATDKVVVQSIGITKPAAQVTYRVGELFDPAGMEVTATYTDATQAVVTDYTYAPMATLTTAVTVITISYTDPVSGLVFTAIQPITVTADHKVAVSSISITKPADKVAYMAGAQFDPAGMEVTATYTDNTQAVVTGYTSAPTGALATTDQEITVSYTDPVGGTVFTATLPITVISSSGGSTGGSSSAGGGIFTYMLTFEVNGGSKIDPVRRLLAQKSVWQRISQRVTATHLPVGTATRN